MIRRFHLRTSHLRTLSRTTHRPRAETPSSWSNKRSSTRRNLDPAHQVLIFAGHPLANDEETLNDHHIQREDTITLVEKVDAAGGGSGWDADIDVLAAATSQAETVAVMERMLALCERGYEGDNMDLLKRVALAARQAKEVRGGAHAGGGGAV